MDLRITLASPHFVGVSYRFDDFLQPFSQIRVFEGDNKIPMTSRSSDQLPKRGMNRK
jgi:hypothetical protein